MSLSGLLIIGSAAVIPSGVPDFPDSAEASPSGNTGGRIAFSSNRDGNFEIYVVNGDGSGLKRLTNDPGADMSPLETPH